jgi:ClpP class serine protease
VAHEIYRLREKLCNTPHLIHPSSFETIIDYVEKRCEDGEPGEAVQATSRYSYNQDLQVAVLNIDGPLTYKPVTMMGFDCGGTSYQQLKEDFSYLVESGVKTVAMNISSGGGEAYQVFATARYMKELAVKNEVKLLSFVDGMAASAAYALASIGDEIILNEGSEVGSIGVVVRLLNNSKQLEKEGVQRIFVTAGDSKVPFDKEGNFREGFLADLQEKVDFLYDEFTEFVATNRSLSVDAVRATEAKTFLPEKALQLGLADSVMNSEEFYTYLADSVQRKENTMLKTKLFGMNNKEETIDMSVNMAQLEELQTQLSQYEAQLSTLQASLEEMGGVKAALEAALGEKETALADAQALVAKLEEEKVEQKLQARKDKLAAVTSADQVEALAASLSSLDDVAFSTVVGAMAAQAKALENSEMFTEVGDQGVEASVEETAAPKTSTTDALIQARLQNR